MILRLIWTRSKPAIADAPQFAMQTLRRPGAWRSLFASVCVHVLLIIVLLHVPPPARVGEHEERPGLPFQIRIGDRLYYVVQTVAPPRPAAAVSARVAPKPRPASGTGRTEPATRAAGESYARQFFPPAMRSNTRQDILLVEPDVRAVEIPSPEAIPKAIAWTAGRWKAAPKPFVEPGVHPHPTVDALKEIAPPEIAITDATAVGVANPRLPVLAAPVVGAAPAAAASAADEGPTGDAVRVLAYGKLSNEGDTLTVPRGNRIPSTAGSAPAVPGSATGGRSDEENPTHRREDGADKGTADRASSLGYASESAQAGADTSKDPRGSRDGANSGTSRDVRQGKSYAGSAGEPVIPTTTAKTGINPSDRLTVAARLTEVVPRTGHLDKDPAYVRITRPANGTFDAVVVQMSGGGMLSEEHTPLTGQPIYTVYLSMGANKDWILQYCVPRERIAQATHGGNVISLAAPTPVGAPYPTVMYKPAVKTQPGERYVVVQGLVTDAGKLEQTRIVRHGTGDTDTAILAALTGWQFRPATRNGMPVSVEVLLAIPPDLL